MSAKTLASDSNPCGPWHGETIFPSIKLLIAVSTRGVHGPEIYVRHAQPQFYSTFQFTPSDFPMLFSDILSKENDRSIVRAFELAMVTGRSVSDYLNLRDKNNISLSCHITVNAGGFASSVKSGGGERTVNGRFTIMTINSASVVGNCRTIGLMLRVPQFIDPAVFEERIGSIVPYEASREQDTSPERMNEKKTDP
jgi:hypothetical protein